MSFNGIFNDFEQREIILQLQGVIDKGKQPVLVSYSRLWRIILYNYITATYLVRKVKENKRLTLSNSFNCTFVFASLASFNPSSSNLSGAFIQSSPSISSSSSLKNEYLKHFNDNDYDYDYDWDYDYDYNDDDNNNINNNNNNNNYIYNKMIIMIILIWLRLIIITSSIWSLSFSFSLSSSFFLSSPSSSTIMPEQIHYLLAIIIQS